jgi:hypothetical protein
MTSVMRKIHIPSVERFLLLFGGIELLAQRERFFVSVSLLANFDLLPPRAVIVSLVRDDRDFVEIVQRRRRLRLPFQAGRAPRIGPAMGRSAATT